MSEKQIQDAIISLFEYHGLYVQRVNSGTIQNMNTGTWLKLADRGHSDLVACDKQNRICFVEVKSVTGHLSPEQITFLRAQNKKGRRWAVCISSEDAQKFLDDEFYHGPQKHVDDVLNEPKRYVSTEVHRKNQKLTMSEFLRNDRWSELSTPKK